MLANESDWSFDAASGTEYDHDRRAIRLVSRRRPDPSKDDDIDFRRIAARALNGRKRVGVASDGFGNRAFWDSSTARIVVSGPMARHKTIFVPDGDQVPYDLAIGHDGVLYIAIEGRVVMKDLRARWSNVTIERENFHAHRLASEPSGGVWVLDKTQRKIGRIQGKPLPDRPYTAYHAQTFRPCPENPDPPRWVIHDSTLADDNVQPVAIACSPEGRLMVLAVGSRETEPGRLYLMLPNGQFGQPTNLVRSDNRPYDPYSIAWVTNDRIAVLTGNLPDEALVYHVGEHATNNQPVGQLYPLRNHDGGPFINGVNLPPHYATSTAKSTSPLQPLSYQTFAIQGLAANNLETKPIDSGDEQTAWHRLYLEASIPPKCGIRVFLSANDNNAAPPDPEDDSVWFEHRFGQTGQAPDTTEDIPTGAWVSQTSEIPYHPGLLTCQPETNRAGLFTVLIQKPNRRVRTLHGRYLHIRIQLIGDGLSTPQIASLRAYASRFSYRDRYLPQLYRESLFGPDADSTGRSTPADFLERFLDNFEGILTPLEDRIAGSYLLTDPRTTKPEVLEWLGSWIGLSFDPAYPAERRRKLLELAPQLFKTRGTDRGLKLALDTATGGGVQSGQIVVLEDFRLRRTFATILGADLADETDPLLGGLAVSGNSFVGDTLFLGDQNLERRKEFLALFAPDLAQSSDELLEDEAIVQNFFDDLAFRVTVLVHEEVHPQDLGLIRRVVELETPAHIRSRVITATHRFMVGVASLVGVDTYLSDKDQPQPVTIDRSKIGLHDLIIQPPRLDGVLLDDTETTTHTDHPVAVIQAPSSVTSGSDINLSGSMSIAPNGRKISRYLWTWVK